MSMRGVGSNPGAGEEYDGTAVDLKGIIFHCMLAILVGGKN